MNSGKTDLERFRSHVEVVGDCWEWTGRIDRYGYGEFKFGGVKHKAHRWIYERLNYKLETGWIVDHLCRNRRCVRPSHLELVTAKENTRRGISHR